MNQATRVQALTEWPPDDDDEQKIRRHAAEVAYENSRRLEEAVERAPAGLDRRGLRAALGPLCKDRSKAGGVAPTEDLDELVRGIERYLGALSP